MDILASIPWGLISSASFGSVGVIALVGVGWVVLRSSSSERLMTLREELIQDSDRKIANLQEQINEKKVEHKECLDKYDQLEGKYRILQEQVSGADTIINVAQTLMKQHQDASEQHSEMIKTLQSIRRALGSRKGD